MTTIVRPAPVEWQTGSIETSGVTPSQGDKVLRHSNDGKAYMADPNANDRRAFRAHVAELMAAKYPGLSRLEPIFTKHVPVALRVELRMPLLKAQEANWAGELQPIIWHAVAKDADKMLRAIGDALTEAFLWADDGQLSWVQVTKIRHPRVGATIEWRAL